MREYVTNVTEEMLAELHARWGRGRAVGRVIALMERAGVQSIVTEELEPESPLLTHPEWEKEVEHYYSNVFHTRGRLNVRRIHFWGEPVRNSSEEEESDSYLGYCDLRPTNPATVSGAIIDLSVFIPDPHMDVYVPCRREYTVPIDADLSKTVTAFPYVQQDGNCIVCAGAALSSMAWHLSPEKELSGPDFESLGSDVLPLGRTFPNPGMYLTQISHCIRQMGYSPVLEPLDDEENTLNLLEMIYPYVESGTPVFVGIKTQDSAHAMIVIGHTFRQDRWLAETFSSYYGGKCAQYKTNVDWIDGLVVQDDNCGPYITAPSSLFETPVCQYMLAPVGSSDYLTGAEAQKYVGEDLLYGALRNYLFRLQDSKRSQADDEAYIDETTATWFEEFLHQYCANALVLRTYMCESEEWRKQARRHPYMEDDSAADLLDNLELPERVWVVEISWPQIFCHKRHRCGEILVDPTDKPTLSTHALKQLWLWIHLPGLVMRRNVTNQDIDACYWPDNDAVYPHHFTSKLP